MLPTYKLVESVLSSIHSGELLASKTIVEKVGIEDSDNHEGLDHHESYDFNWCKQRSRVAQSDGLCMPGV